VGVPKYTSGVQFCKGVRDSLKKKPKIIKIKPVKSTKEDASLLLK